MKKLFFLTLAVTLSCGESSSDSSAESKKISIDVQGLPTLENGASYGVFLTNGDDATKIQDFQVDQNGQPKLPSGESFTEFSAEFNEASYFELRLVVNAEGESKSSRLLGGRVQSGQGVLTMDDSGAFPSAVATASGSLVLTTPTTADNAADDASGVWWLEENENSETVAGLNLPELGEDWIYEGWIVRGDKKVSTGKFRDPKKADDLSKYGGDNPEPGFPGEDLLRNPPQGWEFPLDLREEGTKIVVTLEPQPDDSEEDAFAITPLSLDLSPATSPVNAPLNMENGFQSFKDSIKAVLKVQ